MKPTKFKTLALIIASFCFAEAAHSQGNTNGLQVSAQASLRIETNSPRVFLTVQLVNTSDHEITVLTKNLNLDFKPSSDQLELTIGYSGRVSHGGHLLIPSLYDFAPVTLRPNEAAFIKHEVIHGLEALGKRSDLPLVVAYSVSSEWGKRFGVWSGTAKTSPLTATVRK
jgi:hypothetical protein